MGKEGPLPTILWFVRTVVLIELGIFVVTGVVCWFIGWFIGWCTAYQYGEGLFWAGATAILIGVSSPMANWGLTRGSEYQVAQSVSEKDIYERIEQERKDTAQSYRFLLQMVGVGVVSIVVGAIIQTIFR